MSSCARSSNYPTARPPAVYRHQEPCPFGIRGGDAHVSRRPGLAPIRSGCRHKTRLATLQRLRFVLAGPLQDCGWLLQVGYELR